MGIWSRNLSCDAVKATLHGLLPFVGYLPQFCFSFPLRGPDQRAAWHPEIQVEFVAGLLGLRIDLEAFRKLFQGVADALRHDGH